MKGLISIVVLITALNAFADTAVILFSGESSDEVIAKMQDKAMVIKNRTTMRTLHYGLCLRPRLLSATTPRFSFSSNSLGQLYPYYSSVMKIYCLNKLD